jgi:hypothetical protein
VVGLVPWSTSRGFDGWGVFVREKVGDLWFAGFGLRGNFGWTFIRVLGVDSCPIALIDYFDRFWLGVDVRFDLWVLYLVETVEIEIYFSYFPLEQGRIRSWGEIDVVFDRNRSSCRPIDLVTSA